MKKRKKTTRYLPLLSPILFTSLSASSFDLLFYSALYREKITKYNISPLFKSLQLFSLLIMESIFLI